MGNLNFQDVIRDVHDDQNHQLRTSASLSATTVFVGTPTLYAVVNTSAAGDSVLNIGFATVSVSNPTLYAVVNTGAAGDPKTYIGLTTTTLGLGDRYIGLVTSTAVGLVTTVATGNATFTHAGLVTTVATGNATFTHTGLVTLAASLNFIGLTTTVNGAGTQFMGLVTAWSRNAGTAKTLIPLPIAFAGTSVATVFVPSATFKITSLVLSANSTTQVRIKSGVTYVVGNASIGYTIFPGGGLVDNGSPDSPVYIGLAAAAALVVEKNDATTLIGGKVIYFDE